MLQYLVIAAVIALVLFGIALLVFGRGEQLAPLPARTSPVSLPKQDISGTDVRGVRFALALRGYRMSDVDWTLERLAEELDRAHHRLTELEPAHAQVGAAADVQDQQDELFDLTDDDVTDDDVTDDDEAPDGEPIALTAVRDTGTPTLSSAVSSPESRRRRSPLRKWIP